MYVQHRILFPANGDCCIQLIFIFVKFLSLMPTSLRFQQILAIEKLGKTWMKFRVVSLSIFMIIEQLKKPIK